MFAIAHWELGEACDCIQPSFGVGRLCISALRGQKLSRSDLTL